MRKVKGPSLRIVRGPDPLGRCYYQVRWTDPTTRKRCQVPGEVGWWTESEAAQHLAAVLARLTLGHGPGSATGKAWTVSDVVGEYVEELAERLGAEHAYTIAEDQRTRHLAALLGDTRADRVGTQHLERYAAQRRAEPCRTRKPVARRSIEEEIAAWQRAVRMLRDLGRFDFGPAKTPRLKSIPNDARPHRRLTEAEVAALLRSAEVDGLWSLLALLAWSGRRPIAVFGVHAEDCARVLDDRLARRDRLAWWREDKGGVGRGWGPLTDPAYAALRTVADGAPHGRLFRTGYQNEWTAVRLSRVFDRIADRADVGNVQPYDLRRFACTQIVAAVGGQLAVAQQFTGHRTVASLLRYCYAPQGEAELAAPAIGWSTPTLGVVPAVPGSGAKGGHSG